MQLNVPKAYIRRKSGEKRNVYAQSLGHFLTKLHVASMGRVLPVLFEVP